MWQLGYMASAPYSLAMNDSKTRRSPHKGTASHRKNKYLFPILPASLCCSGWIHRQKCNRERKLHETQMKNLWFYYVFVSFTISRCIAVKWYLRVYWLLPLSIVASFGKHRRLFWKASWILGPVHQLHFPKESFPYFNGLFLISSMRHPNHPIILSNSLNIIMRYMMAHKNDEVR